MVAVKNRPTIIVLAPKPAFTAIFVIGKPSPQIMVTKNSDTSAKTVRL
jgi:hypothetical protein